MTNLEKIRIARDTFAECVEDAGNIDGMSILCFANFPVAEKDCTENTGIVAGPTKDLIVMLMTAMSKNKAVRDLVVQATLHFPDFDRQNGEMIRNK